MYKLQHMKAGHAHPMKNNGRDIREVINSIKN